MKKVLTLALAAIMIFAAFALCSCGGNDEPAETTPGTNNPAQPSGFADVSKTLYVGNEYGLNVRSTPSVEDDTNKIGTLAFGVAVVVTGENTETGWTRIIYNNATAYVKSEFLVAEVPNLDPGSDADVIADDKFTGSETKVYVYATGGEKDEHIPDVEVRAYIRPYASGWTEQTANYSFENYTELTRVGIYVDENGNGWSKIAYKDTEKKEEVFVYIRNSQLVEVLPEGITPGTSATTDAQ